jgi:pimeloyl-ACP methyl ester carboxylesterase
LSTYVLIHAAGSDAWYWHRVAPLLRERGHDVVAPDLPAEDEDAGLQRYLEVVLDAVGDRRGLVVVGHSLGGLTAPLVAAARPEVTRGLVYVNAMVPRPGERGWFSSAGPPAWPDGLEEEAIFFGDLPPELLAEVGDHSRGQAARPLEEPWPLDAHPDVPTLAIVAAEDRCFPADWQRAHVRERLGIEAHVIGGGHCVMLSRPRELTDALELQGSSVRTR